MKWKVPPIIKIYEALGCIADNRITMKENDTAASVKSSSGNKEYAVTYDLDKNSIMANDNGSYWQGYLGYTSVAFLLKKGLLEYKEEFGNGLKGIAWKDVNTKFKNDFKKTREHCDDVLREHMIDVSEFHEYADSILEKIKDLELSMLGQKVKPPEGY